MSHPAKFVQKHPWETAGMAAAVGLGGPAALAALGGGTAASGAAGAGAGLLGASDLTAAVAGDAFMPAALGAGGGGAPGMGSLLGSKLASGAAGGSNGLGKMFAARQGLNLLNPQQPDMGGGMEQHLTPPKPTVIHPQAQVGAPMGLTPEILKLLLQQQQGGMA